MRDMKDSSVEWIGEIPKHWNVEKLKYIAKLSPHCDFSEISDDTIIEYLPMEHIKNGYFISNSKKYSEIPKSLTPFQSGDIVFAKVTPCFENGNIAIMNNITSGVDLGSSELYVIRPFKINHMFIFYWFQNSGFVDKAVFNMTGMGGLKRIPSQFINNLPVAFPPIEEQKKISTYLDNKCTIIDTIIEKQQKIIKKLKEYKLSLITETVKKGLNPDVKMKDSGIEWIGEINDTYFITKIGKLCFVTKLSGFEYTDTMVNNISIDSDVPIVRAQNVRMFRFNKETINEYIDLSTSLKLNRCALTKKALLITFIGAGIGDVCIIDEEDRFHLAPNVAKIEIRGEFKKLLLEKYLMYYIGSYAGKGEIFKIAKASAQPSLSMETIRGIKIVLPDFEEQQEIVDYLDKKCSAIDSSIEKKQAIIEKLKEYKKSLIYECVTGKKQL